MSDAKLEEQRIEQWKLKKLFRSLESARGNGTSVISLIVNPKDQLSRVMKMLLDESARASNIQCRINRQSVLDTISSLVQRLKLWPKIPKNGLVSFCGTVLNAEGNEKKLLLMFEPFKTIKTSLYMCDNKFHTEPLQELLEQDDKFGFIVMDGNGCLFGTLSGSNRTVLYKFQVDLPKKHGRGGQSQLRFARLRLEKRHNYIQKVAELATQHFITNDIPNVKGLILAGSADFKLKLSTSTTFDQRLAKIVLKVVDVAYGGQNGFDQAVELAAEVLMNVNFLREKKLLASFFAEIAKDTGKFCFGVEDTLYALQAGAVEQLIVNEDLDMCRFTLKHPDTQAESVLHMTSSQEANPLHYCEGAKLQTLEKVALVDWLTEHFLTFGARLEFVTDKSQEGSQFCKGFGGIGALLRYKLDMAGSDAFTEVDYDAEDIEAFY